MRGAETQTGQMTGAEMLPGAGILQSESFMFRLALVRHGKTPGNTRGRYIGTTDESLCGEGRKELEEGLKKGVYPEAELIFSSPMKRCLETAGILWPGQQPAVIPGFRECDFGLFENKNYQELNGDPAYQAWIDSNGTLPFPGGESREEAARRAAEAFRQMAAVCRNHRIRQAALVAHGGTIMILMEQFAVPRRDYYDWQVKNGCGFITEVKIEYETITMRVDTGISP